LEYLSQDGSDVTLRIIQKWSDDDVVWIVPYFAYLVDNVDTRSCEKKRNVPALGTVDVTIPCFQGRATLVVIVNDSTIVEGVGLELPNGCKTEADDLQGQKVLYEFNAKCSPAPASCFE
jgi:hypothetical protein